MLAGGEPVGEIAAPIWMPMTEDKLREVIEASECLIGIVMALEGCSREDALRILRQAEIVAYRSAISPDSTDTLH